MIKTWIVTGDTHGDMKRFKNLEYSNPSEVGVIILGDAGCNYYKNKKDHLTKMKLEGAGGYTFYLVRGNHEDRPQNIAGMKLVFDNEVQGEVYMEEDYPHIKYFKDGGIYTIDGHKTLVIGGAYSVDKFYRLQMGYQWFAQELLTPEEMGNIEGEVFNEEFDFILTHTCPISWEPRDLFLSMIDQSQVDKSMEIWMDELKDEITWKVWLFGHYHEDRLERPGVEMFYHDMEELDTIWKRWTTDEALPWWLAKSPNYWMGA